MVDQDVTEVADVGEGVVLDLADGIYTADWSGMVRMHDQETLLAAAFPTKPPSGWFTNPKLRSLTPLTIEDDGRVFGHIASWHTSHIGMTGGIKAPKSKSDYAFFATGVMDTEDGKRVNVGQITLTGGHAPLDGKLPDVVAHYDNTKSAVMDVSVGEDKHGIWVAGALRPDIDELRLRAIRASSVSGDWRPINGHLELVAVCAVNVPGFPIPRARVAAGATMALVAAGVEQLVEQAIQDHEHEASSLDGAIESSDEDRPAPSDQTDPAAPSNGHRDLVVVSEDVAAGLLTLDERLTRIESALTDQVTDRRVAIRSQIEDAIRAAREIQFNPDGDGEVTGTDEPVVEVTDPIAMLRTRVHPEAPADPMLSLRERVHGRPAVATSSEDQSVNVALGEPVSEDEAQAIQEEGVEAAAEVEVAESEDDWDDGLDIAYSLDEAVAASAALVATSTKSWTAGKRKQAASKGQAMKDGSFPIADCTDVGKAVHAMGRSKKSVATVKRHIIKRARSLNCTGKLPDDWTK